MNYRTYGDSDLRLSEVCFGPMRFAEKTPGEDERSQNGVRALHAALDAGVNVIHSSGEYGVRWALQRALERHPMRHEVHHIIKVQSPDYDENGFDERDFVSQIERALSELQTERVAIVQHLQRGPRLPKEATYSTDGDPVRIAAMPAVNSSMLEIFGRLRDQGKVGFLSTFPHTVGFARETLKTGHFSGMVHFFNLLETEMVEFFSSLEEQGMGFIGIRPLLQGLLTDKRIDRAALAVGDSFSDNKWDPWYDLLEAVRAEIITMGETPSSWSAYAIKFCLVHPVVTTVVAGMNSPQQVEQIVAACDGNYPSARVLEAVQRVVMNRPMIPKRTIFG